MTLRNAFGAAALVGVTVLMTEVVHSQARRSTSQPASRAEPDAESQIDVWVRYAMPGKHHRLLDRMAGHWETRSTYWKEPGDPPVTSVGSCERTWILDRRFLREEFDGGILGLPFRGSGLYGYDSFEKKYTSVWIDTMSTAMMTNMGVYDKAGDVVNFVGKYGDPWTGVKKDSRGVTRFVSAQEHVLELYTSGPAGREYKLLEIIYTRKPSPKKTPELNPPKSVTE